MDEEEYEEGEEEHISPDIQIPMEEEEFLGDEEEMVRSGEEHDEEEYSKRSDMDANPHD